MRSRTIVVLTFWTLVPAAAVAAPGVVTGKVFLDANANGRFDAGEKPLAGIGVQDGMRFVKTGVDGAYTIRISRDGCLPWRPAQVVAISWPSGKWPTGRWWRRVDTIRAGESIDFGLRNDKQPLPFAFLHVSDTHDSGAMYVRWAEDVKRMLPMARFAVSTGDMGYASVGNAETMFSSIAKNALAVPIPMFHTAGNHDISPGRLGPKVKSDDPKAATHPLAGFGGYTKHLGPLRWSFDYGGCHFVGVEWPGAPGAFLRADNERVKPGTRVFFFVHYRSGGPRNTTHMFYGHTHVAAHRGRASAVLNLRGNGSCMMGIVRTDGFDVVDRCAGCKGSPTYHSRRCHLRQLTHRLIPRLKGRRGKAHSATNQPVPAGQSRTIPPIEAKESEIAVEIVPPETGSVTLQIGTDKRLDIRYDRKTLHVAGVPIPMPLRDHESSLKMHLHVTTGRFTLYANDYIHFTKALGVDHPARLLVTAGEGEALIKSLTVRELE
jgi:hypothetical protein